MLSPFVILTGASGVGKTSIASAVAEAHSGIDVYLGDTIGIPSDEAMASFGSGYEPGGAWQRNFTLEWIKRIAPTPTSGKPVLFEAQMRLAFIAEGLALQGISHARVILVECNDQMREDRLIHDRQQPELADENMRSWSRYLHGEAVAAGYEILDTSKTPLVENAARIASYLKEVSIR